MDVFRVILVGILTVVNFGLNIGKLNWIVLASVYVIIIYSNTRDYKVNTFSIKCPLFQVYHMCVEYFLQKLERFKH